MSTTVFIVPVLNPDGRTMHYEAEYLGIRICCATREECRQHILNLAQGEGLTQVASTFYEPHQMGRLALDFAEAQPFGAWCLCGVVAYDALIEKLRHAL